MSEVSAVTDVDAFGELVEPHRRELYVHCYRMLGSTHDADDALQDALIRAWRGLGGFEQRSSLRAWLYRVATNACLDTIARRGRRALPVDLGPASEAAVVGDRPLGEVAWLGPLPDGDLPAGPTSPHARYEQREAVELAFVAALQYLPGNQRAALLLVEVIGFSPAELAVLMDTSVASVNSALQRARSTMADRVAGRSQQQTRRSIPEARVRQLVSDYAVALENGDVDGLLALLTDDVTWSMPPLPHWYRGQAAVRDFATQVLTHCGSWRHVLTSANGQVAIASYLWDVASQRHQGWSINVLTLRDDRIAEVTSFLGLEHFATFGLADAVS